MLDDLTQRNVRGQKLKMLQDKIKEDMKLFGDSLQEEPGAETMDEHLKRLGLQEEGSE